MVQTPQRIVPDKGIVIPEEIRTKLETRTQELGNNIQDLGSTLTDTLSELLPDVQICYNALRYALEQDIFFEEIDIQMAEDIMSLGFERAEQLAKGNAPWTTQTGLMVRGYISKLDDSVQPYGIIVPNSYSPNSHTQHRLDIWHHGRNNKLSELRFLNDRLNKPGEFAPDDTFVLHTYGRYCNAMKFAGEIDTLEAIDHAQKHYSIDEDRICVRGFSMGGAATWHQAVHYTDKWVAATPGAGFAETPVYQNALARDPQPPKWEQTLWHLYNATDWAGNLFHCPTIAYSGEEDKQMQAADIMAEYMGKEGLAMPHVIGPGMGHKYHPDSKVEIENWLKDVVQKGRDKHPTEIRFTTYTLRYNKMHWVSIDRLEKHWQRAQLNAKIISDNCLEIQTQNIVAFTIDLETCPVAPEKAQITIDGQSCIGATHFTKTNGTWSAASLNTDTLAKKHKLQGPIDDAFMDSFVMVTPTGSPQASQHITQWIETQQADAIYQWHMQFRGTPRVKTDQNITEDDIANHNLILWGDPSSNAVYNMIASQLPIQWTNDQLSVGTKTFSPDKHVPVFIYPNPLNKNRYIVINSGFTFAPQGASSNANQTPKLPDWAIFDTTRDNDDSNRVIAADFFDESWAIA